MNREEINFARTTSASALVGCCVCLGSLLAVNGCKPSTPATMPISPLPLGGGTKGDFADNPVLQRLADRGAKLKVGVEFEAGGEGTLVVIADVLVTEEMLADVALVRGPVLLRIERCEISRGALRAVDGMASLVRLELTNTGWPEGDLEEIRSFPGLRVLSFVRSRVTQRELSWLVDCAPNLRGLWLTKTAVDDESMIVLSALSHLEVLELGDTRVTDEGVRRLSSIRSLRCLTLGGCAVTDDSLPWLAHLEQLKWLSLAGTGITDQGLASVAQLKQLQDLTICDTSITDAGLLQLYELPKLTYLSVSYTAVTPAGVAALSRVHRFETLMAEEIGRGAQGRAAPR